MLVWDHVSHVGDGKAKRTSGEISKAVGGRELHIKRWGRILKQWMWTSQEFKGPLTNWTANDRKMREGVISVISKDT